MPKTQVPLTEEELYQRLSRRCSVCECAPYDIEQKALTEGATPQMAKRVVERLTAENFLSIDRFAAAFVHDKYRLARWGRIKIQAALRQKRIPNSVIDEEINKIDEEEYAQGLLELLKTKNRQLRTYDTPKRKQKLTAFAASRGFEGYLCYDLVDKILYEE